MSDQGKSDNEKFDNILNYIKALNISLYFLTDNRKIFNSIENTDEDEKDDEDWIISRALFANRKKNTNNQNNEIIKAFNNLENWIKNQTLRGAQLGEENTNAIYDDIVSRITSSRKKKINFENITDLTNRLKQIREENKKYIRFGLTSIADTSKLEDSFSSPEQLKGEKLDIVYNIIEPYTNSLLAKLNSLKDIQSIILNFINTINSYLSNKHLDYNLAKGFTIIDDFNLEPIELGQLSSGERHLLLLLCNIVTISSAPTIYLIDEPEISLNVKWQRKLCRTLIEFSKGKNVQFLLATHSIELLSGFKNATVKLTNQSLIYGTKKFD